jgi:cytochrome P450
MSPIFSEDYLRNPYPTYAHLRANSPLLRHPESGLWMLFDYAGVHRALTDHEAFSSRRGPDWMVFADPPRHTKLRALVSKAFTPRSILNLEQRIRDLSRELLDRVIPHGKMDLAIDFSIPLPLLVIAEMLGIPSSDRDQFKHWNDVMVNMSYTIPGGPQAAKAAADFAVTTGEMNAYLTRMIEQRKTNPTDDLLTRLAHSEVDGERLTQAEILGFFQLLLLAGSETTTNLVNNAILCFIEYPDQLSLLRARPELMTSAIEEVLRLRSPLQWMYRIPRRDIILHGQTIPEGKLVLPVMGSANRDPAQFVDPDRFDITRNPNPHLAFGHGSHFCLGAPLARLEAKIALTDLLSRMEDFTLASDQPWEPRRGLHVHGPSCLPIRFSSP